MFLLLTLNRPGRLINFWGIKSEHFFSWNSWLLLLTFMATYCFTFVRGNLQIQYFGRGDGWGVANKWKENSEYLCLNYHLLFTLFSQFMMLHLLQIAHTFWDNCKKNWTFVKGIFTVIVPVFSLLNFASYLVWIVKVKEYKRGLGWWKRMCQVVEIPSLYYETRFIQFISIWIIKANS